jgi:hypothetical protein
MVIVGWVGAVAASIKNNVLFKVFVNLPATAPSGLYNVVFKKQSKTGVTTEIARDHFAINKVNSLHQFKEIKTKYPLLNAIIVMTIIILPFMNFSFKVATHPTVLLS